MAAAKMEYLYGRKTGMASINCKMAKSLIVPIMIQPGSGADGYFWLVVRIWGEPKAGQSRNRSRRYAYEIA